MFRDQISGMKHIKTIILLIIISINVNAQDLIRYSKTNLYAEILGSGFMCSGNCERLFFINNLLITTGRVGLGFYPSRFGIFGGETIWSGIVPITHSFIFGNDIGLEFGYGITLGLDNGEDAFGNEGILKWFNIIVGMRFQKRDRGILFRMGYTPIIKYLPYHTQTMEIKKKLEIHNWFGFSLGIRLPKS